MYYFIRLFVLAALLLLTLRSASSTTTQKLESIFQNKLESKNDKSHGTATQPYRRQYQNPDQKPIPPHTDIEINNLLSKYQNIIKKYSPPSNLQDTYPGNQNDLTSGGKLNDTERLYIGNRGQIRHHPKWRQSTAGARQRPENYQRQGGGSPTPNDQAAGQATRFTTRITTSKKRRRTTPSRVSFKEDCDYIAYYCLKAYTTGKVCARTLYFVHETFENYCMVDYVNCMERYDIWQIAHMGECFEIKVLTEYMHYPYLDDYFLDQYYVVEDM